MDSSEGSKKRPAHSVPLDRILIPMHIWCMLHWSDRRLLHCKEFYIFFLKKSHKRRLSDGSPAVVFPTVSLKIRRSSDAYVVLRRLSDASSCRFCDGYTSLRRLSDACGSNSF